MGGTTDGRFKTGDGGWAEEVTAAFSFGEEENAFSLLLEEDEDVFFLLLCLLLLLAVLVLGFPVRRCSGCFK